ncbi:hypothetical protein N7533_001986 [Penicillium manginii]|uniref:uncharacterized protein n=1 Tax=Penicillium manginii TaxID=203109 RepID=UPI0025469AC2|nr:uncharacterized protein N7533_001986 [Penicillium manginii]KAJ5763305.1 hypothetical protein N7533_001986 [Penicillium manginii]
MTRKIATKAPVPPKLDEDSAERKRVLNVLAQRRYRKKKRERLQALESRVNDSVNTLSLSMTISPDTRDASTTHESILESQDQSLGQLSLSYSPADFREDYQTAKENTAFALPVLEPSEPSNQNFPSFAAEHGDSEAWGNFAFSEIDPFGSFLEIPALEIGPEPGGLSELDEQLASEVPGITVGNHGISEELQAYEASFFTFPDDHTLEVPSLTLLNAAMKVAVQLKVSDIIWDIASISPFYQPLSPSSSDTSLSPPALESGLSTSGPSPTSFSSQIDLTELPLHLQPTRTQRSIAHHPVLDLLPWPSVRDKLIQVFHLPVHMRPGNAQDPMGLIRFVYDMEDDSGEGVTITGQNPLEPGTWEIGQLVFERWWWAFDTGVIEGSNRSRKTRGKARLAIKT